MQEQPQRIYMRPGRTGQSPCSSPHTFPHHKTEESPKIAAIPYTMVMPKQATGKCSWEPHCPICKNEEEHREEDWDGNRQNQPRMHPQNIQHPNHKILSALSHQICNTLSNKTFSAPNHNTPCHSTCNTSNCRTVNNRSMHPTGMWNK